MLRNALSRPNTFSGVSHCRTSGLTITISLEIIMGWMRYARVALALSLAMFVAACTPPPRLRDVASDLPQASSNQARIFFYGDSVAWKGLRIEPIWRPSITVNGDAIATANGREIVFFVDRSPGTYAIAVDNKAGADDTAPPADYQGSTLSLDVEAGRRYYVKMIRHGPDDIINLSIEPQQHYLQLKSVHQVLGEVEVGRFGYYPAGKMAMH
jgi:hypothetical protein